MRETHQTRTKTTTKDIPNPSFIGYWISGEPMAREREINPQYQKIIQNNNTKRSSSYTKQRCGLLILLLFKSFTFLLPPKKLKSKAQSLPHVYPSTSVCLSLGLGYLGAAVSQRITAPFIHLRFSTLHAKTVKTSERKLDRLAEELNTMMYHFMGLQ